MVENVAKPIINAMLVCDQVIIEARTNKKNLIGVFDEILASQIPCVHAQLGVYVKLSDVHRGVKRIRLELISSDGKTLGFSEGDLATLDQAGKCEFAFNLRNQGFNVTGIHEFRLLLEGNYIGSTFFNVRTK